MHRVACGTDSQAEMKSGQSSGPLCLESIDVVLDCQPVLNGVALLLQEHSLEVLLESPLFLDCQQWQWPGGCCPAPPGVQAVAIPKSVGPKHSGLCLDDILTTLTRSMCGGP